ncbi:MAG: hypothetical protein RI885_175 [Actinomycetota bacterium]|jgi:hypothetical protein
MSRRTADEVIERARASFERGDRRAAWDSLLAMARRKPEEAAYRSALVDLYRRAGSLDQAGRWGAQNLESLTDRERLALRRSLRQFETEGELRRYLVITGDLPPEIPLSLTPSPLNLRVRLADSLESAAGIMVVFFGAAPSAFGIVVTFVMAFLDGPTVRQAAQITVTVSLIVLIMTCATFATAAVLRARWIRAVLSLSVLVLALLVLARADLTSSLPFNGPD